MPSGAQHKAKHSSRSRIHASPVSVEKKAMFAKRDDACVALLLFTNDILIFTGDADMVSEFYPFLSFAHIVFCTERRNSSEWLLLPLKLHCYLFLFINA